MVKILKPPFFDRPALRVARDLLGKYLVRRSGGKTTAVMITEVEAYDGPRDLASHARRGVTPRTKIMFGPAGNFYVYFTYGMHWMLNIVTGPVGYPAAILIRAGIYTDPKTGETKEIKGPARLTKFLSINLLQNSEAAVPATGLWFEDRGGIIKKARIKAGKRIGVDYAGIIWANKPYNLTLTFNEKHGRILTDL